MKAICGYWALDAAPTPPGTLADMRTARVRCANPALEEWRDETGTLAFGSAWWSPQTNLPAPACIATHAGTGCVAIADARLDNPAELRAALDLPFPDDAPDATTDHAATLILHAWLRWGDTCVERIDGDFAFAIHDPRHRLLYLARDRMGVRPLYVHYLPGKRLVFGSTSHAVLAHPLVPRDINEARIADFLVGGLEGVDFTSTFHIAVERHPPRHATRVTAQGAQRHRYWTLEPGRIAHLPSTDDEWAEALTEALERAVAHCLAGPPRVGSMLSGGMDSTSLAIIAGEQLQAAGKPPLPTFSAIDRSRPHCRETRAIDQLLDMPIFAPHVIDFSDHDSCLPEIERFFADLDEPFDAYMDVPDTQYFIAAQAKTDSVIDGVDGDSYFSASSTLRTQIRSGHWRLAAANVHGVSRLYGIRPWQYLRPHLRSAMVPEWLRKLLQPLRSPRGHRNQIHAALISGNFAERIGVAGRLQALDRLHTITTPVAAAACETLSHTFPVVGIERYHRVAMRHGITPLHPFAERRVLELGVNLPDTQRLRSGRTKAVLRHAMIGRMPETVRLRFDKEHLGTRLGAAFWLHKSKNLRQALPQKGANQTIWLERAKLDALLAQPIGSGNSPLLYPAILAQWLRSHSH